MTGAFLLAEAGILNVKTATIFHSSLDNLSENYPEVDVTLRPYKMNLRVLIAFFKNQKTFYSFWPVTLIPYDFIERFNPTLPSSFSSNSSS